jgi:hypothetical protein
MQTRALIVKRIALGSLAQWGFVAGVVIACLPAFVCSWIFFTLVQTLRGLIAGWRDVGIDILGQRLSVNLVEVLKLQDALASLTNVASFGVFGIVLVGLALAALLGLFGALVLTLLGIFYNATGRVRLEVEEVRVPMQEA